ncbi:hypothetical protein A7982_12606 [Minicystis rosea]|nr:hypothetical protein A7982_12606 [Minicystis rosea]
MGAPASETAAPTLVYEALAEDAIGRDMRERDRRGGHLLLGVRNNAARDGCPRSPPSLHDHIHACDHEVAMSSRRAPRASRGHAS